MVKLLQSLVSWWPPSVICSRVVQVVTTVRFTHKKHQFHNLYNLWYPHKFARILEESILDVDDLYNIEDVHCAPLQGPTGQLRRPPVPPKLLLNIKGHNCRFHLVFRQSESPSVGFPGVFYSGEPSELGSLGGAQASAGFLVTSPNDTFFTQLAQFGQEGSCCFFHFRLLVTIGLCGTFCRCDSRSSRRPSSFNLDADTHHQTFSLSAQRNSPEAERVETSQRRYKQLP